MPITYDLFLPKWYCHIGKKYKKNKKKKTPSPFLLKPLKFLAGSKSRGGWRGKVQNHKNGKELVQSLIWTLVDCYFVHLCTLGVGALALCARRTTLKLSPFIFDGLPHHQPRRDGLAMLLPGYNWLLRVVFTSLPLQRHHMWSKYMRWVDGICGQ